MTSINFFLPKFGGILKANECTDIAESKSCSSQFAQSESAFHLDYLDSLDYKIQLTIYLSDFTSQCTNSLLKWYSTKNFNSSLRSLNAYFLKKYKIIFQYCGGNVWTRTNKTNYYSGWQKLTNNIANGAINVNKYKDIWKVN